MRGVDERYGCEMVSYFKDVGRTHPLSREEERTLGLQIQAGSVDARNRLVTANLRFGVAVARRYQGRGLPLGDLIGAANIGLIEAAKRFDFRARFITYASWWIRRCVIRALREANHPVHVPAHVHDLLQKVRRGQRDLLQDLERAPTVEELAAFVNEREDRVRLALLNAHETQSLDQETAHYADGGRRLASRLAEVREDEPDVLEHIAIDDEVDHLLTELPEREVEVVRHYYGLGGLGEGNLAEIGRELNLSRERVRQIKTAAVNRMKEAAAGSSN